MKTDIEISKTLSYALRHAPEKVGLKLDKAGWTPIEDVLEKLDIHLDTLLRIVENNDKQRFEISEDLIRASQGHSIDVDLGYKETTPPESLYHGTAFKNLDSIKKDGITKMKRHHVHLSDNISIALSVGSRHGKPTVLIVNTRKCMALGIKFYRSTNGVWLADYIPNTCIN